MAKAKIDTSKLIELSNEAMKNAYCVYSNFPVGAALLCDDGTIYTGCNVENASYGLSFCAERTAAVKAVSEGRRNFVALALSARNANVSVFPCGACRQFLAEFGNTEMKIITSNPNSNYTEITLGELLPHNFKREHLGLL